MRHFAVSLALIASPVCAVVAAPAPAPVAAAQEHAALVHLFQEWRAFNHPAIVRGRPDYGAAAMARMAEGLSGFKARLAAIDPAAWSVEQRNDHRFVAAEMNGLDFFLRVLKPWARDPTFYANFFPEMSDVPAHEGSSAEPTIDVWTYHFPLSRADDARLAEQVGAIPALLDDAKVNLAGSTAHDLWAYGDRAFADQADALAAWQKGELTLRDLDGVRTVSLQGASPALKAAVERARVASAAFADWIRAEAPRRQGPSGVGKDNYDWYLKNVLLSPYSFDDQKRLLERELERSLASLRLEESRNRTAPPIAEIDDPAAYFARSTQRAEQLYRLWVDTGTVADKPYFRSALLAQLNPYTPPSQRNFFTHVIALDVVPLSSHQFHWIELARLKHEPHPSPIRAVAPLFNNYSDRSEGWATAMEEVAMQQGAYDDLPHGRELVWIMLANRAARGLASLRVQANEIGLDEAGKFHAAWTPRGWSDPKSKLVGFEQLMYLRQPGYGPSYIIGKLQLDTLLAKASHQADAAGKPFDAGKTFDAIWASGIVQPALIEEEMLGRLR